MRLRSRSSEGRIIASAIRTVTYDAASMVKHQPYPTTTISAAPIDGPTIRERFTSALYSVTALGTSDGGTISLTNDRRVGLSNARKQPPKSVTRKNNHSGDDGMNASTASAID